MSAFTDRLVAAGVTPGIATEFEADLLNTIAKAKATRARLTAEIDKRQTEIDGLKAERKTAADTIDAIRTTVGDPNL